MSPFHQYAVDARNRPRRGGSSEQDLRSGSGPVRHGPGSGSGTPTGQDRLIAEADELTPENPSDVHTLDSSHTGFLLQAPKVARILDGLAL